MRQLHGEEPQSVWQFLGTSTFWFQSLQNWQSEFLQLLTFVVLTSFLVHRGSHESKDSNDKMQAQLQRIEQRLEHIESAGADVRNGVHQRAGELELARR